MDQDLLEARPPDEDDDMTIPFLLRHTREQLGWSRRKLAAQSGISEKSIEKYEAGVSKPPLERLVALCKALSIDIGDMVAQIDPSLPAKPQRQSSPRGQGFPDDVARTMSMLLAKYGYSMRFTPRRASSGDDPQSIDAADVEGSLPGLAEISEYQNFVQRRGMAARTFPSVLASTVEALQKLDHQELVELAEALDLSIDDPELLEISSPRNAPEDHESQKRERANRLEDRILVQAAVPDFHLLSFDALKEINTRLSTDDKLPVPEPFLFIETAGYRHEFREKLIQHLPRFIVQSWEERSPLDLLDQKTFPRDDAPR